MLLDGIEFRPDERVVIAEGKSTGQLQPVAAKLMTELMGGERTTWEWGARKAARKSLNWSLGDVGWQFDMMVITTFSCAQGRS